MMRSIIANLTPASRRQDHTTSPSAIASFVHAKKHVTTLLRPPHPVPTFVTMANAPLFGTGRTAKATDLRARTTTTAATDWHDGQISKIVSRPICLLIDCSDCVIAKTSRALIIQNVPSLPTSLIPKYTLQKPSDK
jgi:hypothetical protein